MMLPKAIEETFPGAEVLTPRIEDKDDVLRFTWGGSEYRVHVRPVVHAYVERVAFGALLSNQETAAMTSSLNEALLLGDL